MKSFDRFTYEITEKTSLNQKDEHGFELYRVVVQFFDSGKLIDTVVEPSLVEPEIPFYISSMAETYIDKLNQDNP